MRPFALGLIDSEMPGLSGIELARKVKADPQLASIELVLVTTFSQRVESSELKQLGFSASVPKPVTYSGLFDALMTVLGEQPLQKKADWRQEILQSDVSQRGVRILLAEDNPVNQKVAVNLLSRAGYQIEVAANGAIATEMIESDEFDVILMDMEMPVMDGITATRIIRQQPGRGATVPIIAMTANVMQSDRESCLAAGMNDFVTKPIEPQLLFDTLRKHVAKLQSAAPTPPATSDSTGAQSDTMSIDPSIELRSTRPYEGVDPLAPKSSAPTQLPDPLAPASRAEHAVDPLASFSHPSPELPAHQLASTETISVESSPSLPTSTPTVHVEPDGPLAADDAHAAAAQPFKLSFDPLAPAHVPSGTALQSSEQTGLATTEAQQNLLSQPAAEVETLQDDPQGEEAAQSVSSIAAPREELPRTIPSTDPGSSVRAAEDLPPEQFSELAAALGNAMDPFGSGVGAGSTQQPQSATTSPSVQAASGGFWASQGVDISGSSARPVDPPQPVKIDPLASPISEQDRQPAVIPVTQVHHDQPAPVMDPPSPPSPEPLRPMGRADIVASARAQMSSIFGPKTTQPHHTPADQPQPEDPQVHTTPVVPIAPSGDMTATSDAPEQPGLSPQQGSVLPGAESADPHVPQSDHQQDNEELLRRFAPVPQESLMDQLGYGTPSPTVTRAVHKPDPLSPAAPRSAAPTNLSGIEDMPEGLAPQTPPAAALDSIFGVAPASVSERMEPTIAPQIAEPAVAEAEESIPPIDIAASISRIGDEGFWAELILTFAQEVEQRIATLERAMRLGDNEAVRHEAHTIKGSSAELVVLPLRDIALKLEKSSQEADFDQAASLVVQLRREFERFRSFIESERPGILGG
jgi:CheY-like chemotaxis protein/HPt (histidine-containing phosphotransfer) domain-containing protein